MKKHSNSYGGSASMIIIAILFLALMGALGVVFYQNFVAKPAAHQPTEKTATPAVATKTARVAFNSAIYALDYPGKGWKVTPETNAAMSMATFTNTGDTIRVTLMASKNTVTTSCSAGDGLQIGYYNVESATAETLTGAPLYLVASISDNPGGGYQYKIGLVPDSGDTHASVGASHCDVAHVGLASTVLTNNKGLVHPTIQATIDFPKLPVAPKAASPDMQTIKDLINTDDYKAAVKILESARKE